MERALKVAKKKDDVYYNISKQIYNYQLGKPEKTYKDWTYEKALDYVHSALAIDSLPVYVQPVPLSLCRKASAHCRSAILHCGTLV